MTDRNSALKTVLAVAALAVAGVMGSTAMAQDAFPSKPVTLIVPWAAGGGSDISMRLLAEAASQRLGQPIVVVNRPGAGGAEGTREIASAVPDGYTIGMEGTGLIARTYTNPNANAYTDLLPIVFFGADPGAVVTNPSTGFNTAADFVEAAKAAPESVVNGNDQPGGTSYINAAVIENTLGIQLTKVPYEGFAPTVTALLSGEVMTATVPVPDAIEHHKAGTLRILGVTDTKRHFMAPDVPTFQEQGFDVVVGAWRVVIGPNGIPQDRLAILEAALLETLSDPAFIERANAAGFEISPKGSQDTIAFMKQYDDLLYPILKDAGLITTRERN